MKLSVRLQTIYNMVPKSVAADVGSDHGKLIISLFENGIISKGYAIENKKGPFSRLYKEIESRNLLDNVVPMFSDGISDLPSDCETVIIAGMGGTTIVDILKAHKEKLKNVKTIIVDAHNSIPEVRKEVSNLGFNIADEDILIENDIYYEVIKFVAGDVAFLDKPDIEFGPYLRKEKSCTFIQKYQRRVAEIDNLIKTTKLPDEKIRVLSKEKERIMNVL